MSAEPVTSPASRTSDRRKGPSFTRRFVTGAAVDSFGTGLTAAAVILYFVDFVGFSARSVGFAMSAGAVLGLLSPIPVGWLADRFGLIRVYCVVLLLRGAGYVAYAWSTHYTSFFLLTLVLMGLETTTPPLQQSLVGHLFEEDSRVRVMTTVMAARNAALGAGTLVAGLALTSRSHALVAAALVVNGLSFFFLAVMVFSMRRVAEGGSRSGTAHEPPADAPVTRDLPFLGLAGLNGLLLLHDSVLFVLLPLWMVSRLGISPMIMTAMLALNTALSVVLQFAFGRMKRLREASGVVLTVSVAFLVSACGVCIAAEHASRTEAIVAIAFAVTLLTVGENLHALAGWQVSFRLAPPARRGEYMSAFNMGYGLQRVVGPLLMTAFVLAYGTLGWLGLSAIFIGALLGFRRLARVQPRRSLQEHQN